MATNKLNFINTSKLLTENEIIEFLAKSLTCPKDDNDKILNYIKKLFDKQFNENTQEELKNYMTWVEAKGNLKVSNAPVPRDVVSEDCYLHDVRIESKGPDDKIYDREPSLRAKVARGNCVMELTRPDQSRYYDLLIFALRKFTGGLGDEDDVDRDKNEWEKYFLTDIEKSKFVISTQKANGEAAHLSCRWHNNSFLICTGSKNVHLLFRKKADILLNYGDSRYKVAKEVSYTICKYLEELDVDLRNMFLSFLCLTRLTIVFEILQPENQHVEDLSYLSEPLLKFIAFTQTKIFEKPTSLCYMPPHYCFEIAKLFQLSCVDCKIVPFEKTEEHIVSVRKDHGYEGAVLYFMDEEMNIIGILKKKTTWYIILRAIREKFRSYLSPRRNVTASELEKNIATRLKQIQTWIGFDDDYFNHWKDLALNFAKWFTYQINSKKVDRDIFYNKYPTLWTKFLEEKQLKDKFEMNPHENEEIVHKDKKFNASNFNKLCIPDDYIPDEKDVDDENEQDNKDEKEVEKSKEKTEDEKKSEAAANNTLVKQIQDQLLNPTQRLSKKDKKKLKKKLKKQLKKSGDKASESDDDDDDDFDIDLDSLSLKK